MSTGYTSENICLDLSNLPDTYTASLLKDKIRLLNKYCKDGIVVDVCCGNGNYLKALSGVIQGVGIDYCADFIKKSDSSAYSFVCADGRQIPLKDNCAALSYSLSALYALENPEEIIEEMIRITKPGGIVVLDLVNSCSLNGISSMQIAQNKPQGLMKHSQMRQIIRERNLRVVEQLSFQILPYWSNKPNYLKPFLLPFWGRIMKKRVKGKMLDQWVSELSLLKPVAGRHIFVCQK